MSGFTENRASDASEWSGPAERMMTWQACRAMLPLVDRIARDVAARHVRLTQIRPELARLEKNRLSLSWPDRHRRYQYEEEVVALEAELRGLVGELDALGVTLLEGQTGLVGFPTRVNDLPAFFSWKPGESGPDYWNYAGDLRRRPVPEDWTVPLTPRPSRQRRSKK